MRTQASVLLFISIMIVSALGCEYVPPVTDHQKGYQEGRQVVEYARHEHGELGAQVVATGAEMNSWFGPIDKSESPQWNKGVQQGVRDAANGR